MKKNYDVIIVGSGSIGMATGYYLSKFGARVLLIDQYDVPHTLGSHHGDTRLVRHAYRKKEYVSFAVRAQELWGELEKETGRNLFLKTGVISIGSPGSSIESKIQISNKENLNVSILSALDIQKRWPGIQIPDKFVGVFEPDAGIIYCEEVLHAYRDLSTTLGADILPNTKVRSLRSHRNFVEVQTDDGQYIGDKILISAGAWTNQLLSNINLHIPIKPIRKIIGWFDSDESLFNSEVFPGFTFDLGNEVYYGFPSLNGSGVKIGRHDGGDIIDPELINREFGLLKTDEGDIRKFLEKYLPDASGGLKKGSVCIYTNTPDSDFIIDTHPQYPNIHIAAGFSGHGFKFASVIGEILSKKMKDQRYNVDLSMFLLRRFHQYK